MKQKTKQLQSLLLLLILTVVGTATAWAEDATYVPQGLKTVTSNETVYASSITGSGTPASDWVIVPNHTLESKNYTNTTNDSNGNPSGITDNITTASSVSMIKIKNDGNTLSGNNRVVHMHLKGITGVIGHGCTGGSGKGMAIACTEYVSGSTTTMASASASVTRSGNSGSFICQVTGLDASKEYIVSFYAAGSSAETDFYCAELIAGGGASPVAVTSVSLDQTSKTIGVGDSFTLTPTILPADATNKNVSWSSSAPGKASVSDGTVTGVAAGNATITVTTVDGNHTATCNVTVEAASGYSITYNANTMADGETSMATAPSNVASATALPSTLPTPDDVKQGYTFEGWYTNPGLTTKATAGAAIADNTTLYANYTINSATLSPASGDNMYSQETITITPPTGVTMTGIKYKWSDKNFSNKSTLLDSGTYLATSSTFTGSNAVGDTRKLSLILTDGKWWSASVIQATYNVKYKVTYDGNGNTGGTAPTDAGRYAKNATPTVLDNTGSLVKTNYSFDGWNTANDGSGVNYAAGATLPAMTANVTLYAKWLAASTYTLTINGNGGSGGSASVTATLNQTLPSFTAPVRAGYLLKGYYTESSNGTKVINADGTLVASVSDWTNGSAQWIKASNETLFAQWDAIYTVTFDATTNGGSCATASLTQESAEASIILPNASKEGNTFSVRTLC